MKLNIFLENRGLSTLFLCSSGNKDFSDQSMPGPKIDWNSWKSFFVFYVHCFKTCHRRDCKTSVSHAFYDCSDGPSPGFGPLQIMESHANHSLRVQGPKQ